MSVKQKYIKRRELNIGWHYKCIFDDTYGLSGYTFELIRLKRTYYWPIEYIFKLTSEEVERANDADPIILEDYDKSFYGPDVYSRFEIAGTFYDLNTEKYGQIFIPLTRISEEDEFLAKLSGDFSPFDVSTGRK